MTQVLVAIVAVLALAMMTLAMLVFRLRAVVRGISGSVASGPDRRGLSGLSLRSSTALRVPRQPLPSIAPDAAQMPQRAPNPTESHDGQVAVITGLDGEDRASGLTTARVASVALGRPLIKAAAFTYGVRRALDDEHRLRMTLAFRRELRRQRKLRRRRGRNAAVREAAS